MDDAREKLVAELLAIGYWADNEPEDQTQYIQDVLAGAYPLNSLTRGRAVFDADGEDLMEGGVEDLLRQMAPALAEYGVNLATEPVKWSESDDDVYCRITVSGSALNPRKIELHILDDFEYAALVQPFELLNTLLFEAGSQVRIFTLHAGGNEGLVLLLDPLVPEVMRRSGLFESRDIPILPRDFRPQTI